MTRIQTIVDTLFEQFPSNDLGGGPERFQFDRLREVLAAADDWPSTLRRLHQAEGCDELALSLLWMTDRLEQDAARTFATTDEEDAFQRSLRRSLGLSEAAFSGFGAESAFAAPNAETPGASSEEPMAAFGAASIEGSSVTMPDDAPTLDVPASEETVPIEESGPAMPMGDDDAGTSDPEIYGRLLERFLEAVQSGADDRNELLTRLRANNRAVQADASMPEEYQRYATLLDDFLGYIEDHQLLDDVRVMNLVTNLQEPFGQWLSTDEASRVGILDQCVEMQRDFRAMFE
ncbi:MAG: hypothetical protein MUE68_01655 [Bacteroidetes bacterium]|jgi:hypothetical protein|nr:hypothetical protein [Bacteroidota bacterium]